MTLEIKDKKLFTLECPSWEHGKRLNWLMRNSFNSKSKLFYYARLKLVLNQFRQEIHKTNRFIYQKRKSNRILSKIFQLMIIARKLGSKSFLMK